MKPIFVENFNDANWLKKRHKSKNVFIKILGRPIGGVATFDGDVDGHVTGPDGEDNIPFVAPKSLIHAGSQYLKSLDEQKSVLEKEFGDLSKTENATRAFKQTFKNLREFNMFDPKKTSLSALELAHTISLLHLGKDKRVADTVHYIGDARVLIGEKNWNGTNAASILGFSMQENDETLMQHSIVFNKEVIGYSGGDAGWGDAIASQMKKQGASTEDIDKFWGMYVANHEWVHTEHHVSAMEHLGVPINGSVYDLLKKIAQLDGVDEKTFDLGFQKRLKELKLEQPDADDEEIRNLMIILMMQRGAPKFMERITSSKNDDLSRGELSQLGGRYPSTVSLYATENFAELVAEKSSASRMGHPAGNPNNPAWRKLEAFVRGGVTQEVATAGMTRQQRRQLERANQNKKELDKNNYFDGIDINDVTESDTDNMVILSTCTGFPHSLKERQEKALKVLGTPIGAKPDDELVDGDGDGLSTGGIVGGEDKIPVVPKTVKKVFGFIGKLKHKLGDDGSIHPLALNREIWEELESVMEDKYAAAEFAKKMVAKNLALAMSDVTASEIADTILDLMPDEKEYDDGEIEGLRHTVKEQMNLVKKISNSSEPLPFVVTDKGDIIPDAFSPAQENAWVDEQFEKYKGTFGDLNFMMGNGQTTEQYERKKLRERYQYLLSKSAQYTHPSPESEQALKEAGLRVLVGSWAISSNDSNPLSLAIQDVAQKMFKIDWAVGWYDNGARRNFSPSTEFADNKVLKSFVRAQYDATQKYLASKGIKKVTLYRGMQDITIEDYGDGSEVKTVEVLLRPLSAWSTDAKEAETFAGRGSNSVVIKATIPAQDIFSIPLTGVGCLKENEVVIKSGAVDGVLREPIPYPITDEKKEEFQQWAYGEQTGEPPAWLIQLRKDQLNAQLYSERVNKERP